MKKSVVLTALVLALSFVLAACGGGAAGGASTSIDVKMTDFKFTPDAWTVAAGKQVTLKISNEGSIDHDWALMLKPVEAPFDASDQPNVVAEFKVAPGKSETVTFTAPAEAGEYEVICSIAGHFEAGMVGKLTVQ